VDNLIKNMDEKNLQRLCGIAQAAGQEIMAVYEQGGATWQKADTSPLTEADLRADQVIRQGSGGRFSGCVYPVGRVTLPTGYA
jgi:3'-phosphoadenosine 5'-phosphosulfate (PAPS) 3'-phosphatase